MGRLVMLSGPSCVGKGPLHAALRKFYPELASRLHKLVLYNTRAPRPGEVEGEDYYFRPRQEIERFKDDPSMMLLDVRGDLQALDLRELETALAAGDAFFEGNPFVARALQTSAQLTAIEEVCAFLSPLSRAEVIYLSDPERMVRLPDFVTDVMRRKLLRRTRKQKGILSLRDLENIEKRAGSAYDEMRYAHHFDWVLPNHDGEDSENWDAFYYPVGDAHRTLLAFAAVLAGEAPEAAEKWEADLLP